MTTKRMKRAKRISKAVLAQAEESLKLVYGLPPFEQGTTPFPDPSSLRDIRDIYCKPYGLSLEQLEERTGVNVLRRQWERIREAGFG